MVLIKVLLAASRKRAIKCSQCAIMYSPTDYGTLYKNKKLIYFQYTAPQKKRSKVYCHDCILRAVADSCSGDSQIQLKIIDEEYEWDCEFFPSELGDGDSPLDNFF
jgi:hypothetical protein